MVIILFFSKHLKYFIFVQSLQILPQFQVKEVDLGFYNLLHTFWKQNVCLSSVFWYSPYSPWFHKEYWQ